MKRKIWIWFIPLALIILFVFVGVLPKVKNQQELLAAVEKEKSRKAIVNVVKAAQADSMPELTLPGEILPYRETVLYARTQGFLDKRYVDIGSEVNRGQLLARIEAPEVDQELLQARSDKKLANSYLERTKSVTLQGAVAQQEIDSREAAYEMQTANVRRLEILKSLQEIRAPFGGIITNRNIEVGALVNGNSNMPMFTLAQLDTLRVLVDVPQAYYRSVKLGQSVTVTIPEIPGKVFTGEVMRTSQALRSQSRTLLTEVVIPNNQGELVSGLYGQASFKLQQDDPAVIIPANTLLIEPEGPAVMCLMKDKTLKKQMVEIGRDFGTSVEIVKGLDGGEQLVANPTDRLKDGQEVEARSVTVEAD